MATLTDEQAKLFAEPNYAALTTLRKDGSPQTSVIWVDRDDDGVWFNTAVGRAKERYLRRDPRLSINVIDSADPYRWVTITGRARFDEASAEADIDRLAKKYLDADTYPYRMEGEQRTTVRVDVDRVDSYGYDT